LNGAPARRSVELLTHQPGWKFTNRAGDFYFSAASVRYSLRIIADGFYPTTLKIAAQEL